MVKIGAFTRNISGAPIMCQGVCWGLGPSTESDIGLACKGLIVQWTRICNPTPSTSFPLGAGHQAPLTMPRGLRRLPILELRVSGGEKRVNGEPALRRSELRPVLQVCPSQGESYCLSH